MDKLDFVVVDENVLGYINPAQPGVVGILHASPLRGATVNDLDGWMFRPLNDKGMRAATRQDFDEYRVSSEVYQRNPERYNFPAA